MTIRNRQTIQRLRDPTVERVYAPCPRAAGREHICSWAKPKDFKGIVQRLTVHRPLQDRSVPVLVMAVGSTVFKVGPRILGKATTEVVNDW